MVIKQYHGKELYALISLEILLILFTVYGSINCYIKDWKDRVQIIILAYIIIQIGFLYFFSFELRTYIINDNRIVIKWLGIYSYPIEWFDVISVNFETVKLRSIEHSSIVVTKIPVKKIYVPIGTNSYYSAVDYDWLQMRPCKVIAIYLEDLKPGQYEEFWSYVPDRLKGNFKPKEEIVDN